MLALTSLQEIGRELYAGKIDRDGARSALAALLLDHLECSRVSLWRFDGEPGTLALLCFAAKVAGEPLSTTETRLHEPQYRAYFDGLVVTGMYVCTDAMNDPRLAALREPYLLPHGVRSMMDAAILVNGRAYGMVCCEQTDAIRRWRKSEAADLRAIVAKLALLMASAGDAAFWNSPSVPIAPIDSGVATPPTAILVPGDRRA